MNNEDLLDELLTTALQGRPEHVPAMDIAGAAVERANASNARLDRLQRIARWTRIASAAAVLLVAMIIGGGYLYWRSLTSSATAATATVSSAGGFSLDTTTMGLVAFLAAVSMLTLLMVMTPERQAFRLSPG